MSNQPEGTKKGETVLNFVKIIAGIFVILTPLTYLTGAYFEYIYLEKFGVNQEIFSRSHEHYFIKAFEAISLLLFKITPYLIPKFKGFFVYEFRYIAMILMILGVVLIYLIVNKNKLSEKLSEIEKSPKIRIGKSIIAKHKNKLWIATAICLPIILLNSLFYITWFLLGMSFALFSISFIILPYIGLAMGESKADKEIENFDFNKCINRETYKNNTCTYILPKNSDSFSDVIISGHLVAKSKEYVAIWNGEAITIYPISNNEKIRVFNTIEIDQPKN